jgi:uncharacterized protein
MKLHPMTKKPCLHAYHWLLLLLISFSPATRAELVNNLYEAESPVVGQGGEARADGIRDAFAKVLVKVSGERSVLSDDGIKDLLRRASGYVQEYRYRALGVDGAGTDAGKPDRMLWVRFDERAVNRMLRKSGLPVWGATRPTVLVWLGEETGAARSLISLEQRSDLKAVLQQVADARGLPLLFPLMDIEDRSALPVSDLWGGFEGDIRRASARYLPDVILVGLLRGRGGNDWQGEWTLYLHDKTNRWSTRAGSESALAEDGLQQAADALALRFAPQQVSEGMTTLRIRIHGVNQLADYILVRDYLQSMAMIEQLDLLAATPEHISFLVRIQGGREVLERGIQLGAVLEPVAAQAPTVTDENAVPEGLEGESLDYRIR